jgi:hypothetical protein
VEKLKFYACAKKKSRLGAAIILCAFSGLCLAGCSVEVPFDGFYEMERRRLQRIVTENMERIFGERLNLDDIAISRWRETSFNSEAVRQICIKPIRGSNGSVNAISVYVMHFRGNQIVHSQPALAEHGCEEETYAPLAG